MSENPDQGNDEVTPPRKPRPIGNGFPGGEEGSYDRKSRPGRGPGRTSERLFEGGDTTMTELDDFRDDLEDAVDDVEAGKTTAQAAYNEITNKYEGTVEQLEELGADVEQLLSDGRSELCRLDTYMTELEASANNAENVADQLETRGDNVMSRLGY